MKFNDALIMTQHELDLRREAGWWRALATALRRPVRWPRPTYDQDGAWW